MTRRPTSSSRGVLLLGLTLAACGPGKADTTEGGVETTSSAGTSDGEATTGVTSTGQPTSTGQATSTGTSADVTTGGTEASTADSSTTGVPLPEQCECDPEAGCGEVLCELVLASVDCEPPDGVQTPEALQCALAALRDRTPGVIKWEKQTSCSYAIDWATISIFADGTAVYSPSGGEDLSWSTGPVWFGMLDPSDFFAGCLAEPDPMDGFQCLAQVLSGEPVECSPLEWVPFRP
jgi:hypothetical protein